MNDNYTKQSEDNIMSDEGNSRLMIRISKAMPVLLRQFIGQLAVYKGNFVTYELVNSVN